MKKRSKSNNNPIQSYDLDYKESIEENGLCELPITDKPIAQFSFQNNFVPTNEPMLKEFHFETKEASAISSMANPPLNSAESSLKEIKDNKVLRSQPFGITPPINGEYFDVRRSFSFRESTVRMLNELKAAHPDINVYLNSIVDKAICHYHEYIFKEKGSQG
jgi:hypothetical protein